MIFSEFNIARAMPPLFVLRGMLRVHVPHPFRGLGQHGAQLFDYVF